MSDGYERPSSLAAVPLEFVTFDRPEFPLTVAPCALARALAFQLPEGS